MATAQSDYDANRSLNSLEGLIGLKQDINQSVAWHLGGGTKLSDAIGNPDWRIYAGINWAVGPICSEESAIERIEIPPLPRPAAIPKVTSENLVEPAQESFRVDVALLF